MIHSILNEIFFHSKVHCTLQVIISNLPNQQVNINVINLKLQLEILCVQ